MTAVLPAVRRQGGRFVAGRGDLLADRCPLYTKLRREAPAYLDEEHGTVFVARYADVERVSMALKLFLMSEAEGGSAQAALERAGPEPPAGSARRC